MRSQSAFHLLGAIVFLNLIVELGKSQPQMQEQRFSSEIPQERKNDVFRRTIREIKAERDQNKRDAIARVVGALLVSAGVHAFLFFLAFVAAA
tara:strand:- start:364 stop:642 length:279 start_codon:yes stop_codon:yes gene_type:complete